jgi:hypothetical protein
MEINLTIPEFRKRMDDIADKLIVVYSISEVTFKELYKKLPVEMGLFLFELYEKPIEDDDVADKLLEVFNYYYSSKLRNAKIIDFTLRSSDHLKRFEEFLIKMEILHDNFPEDFIELFPQCPEVYWDKIDDLRETSFKNYRDSAQFTRCLTMSKKLSFGYEKLLGIEINEEEYE